MEFNDGGIFLFFFVLVNIFIMEGVCVVVCGKFVGFVVEGVEMVVGEMVGDMVYGFVEEGVVVGFVLFRGVEVLDDVNVIDGEGLDNGVEG